MADPVLKFPPDQKTPPAGAPDKAAAKPLLAKLAGLKSELTATALEGINPADAHRLLTQLETIKENVRNAIQNPAGEPPKKEQRYG